VIEAGLFVSRLKGLAHIEGMACVTIRISTAMIAYNHENIKSNKNGVGRNNSK
jgi:hypothetical protein